MTINRFSSPLHLKDDIDEILLFSTPINPRVKKLLMDISGDLEALQEVIKAVDKWDRAKCSDQELIAAYNKFCSVRGKLRYE